MSFSDTMMDFLDQGITASKEFAVKAGAKTRDLGEKGVLLLDIKRLEAQARKLIVNLGKETYIAFIDRKQDSIHKDTPEIDSILKEFEQIREKLEVKKTELKNKQ